MTSVCFIDGIFDFGKKIEILNCKFVLLGIVLRIEIYWPHKTIFYCINHRNCTGWQTMLADINYHGRLILWKKSKFLVNSSYMQLDIRSNSSFLT